MTGETETECPACRAAQDNPTTPMFHGGCRECSARALAGSPQFFYSVQAGRMTDGYRAALKNVFRSDLEAGHRLVKSWFERISQYRRGLPITPPKTNAHSAPI